MKGAQKFIATCCVTLNKETDQILPYHSCPVTCNDMVRNKRRCRHLVAVIGSPMGENGRSAISDILLSERHLRQHGDTYIVAFYWKRHSARFSPGNLSQRDCCGIQLEVLPHFLAMLKLCCCHKRHGDQMGARIVHLSSQRSVKCHLNRANINFWKMYLNGRRASKMTYYSITAFRATLPCPCTGTARGQQLVLRCWRLISVCGKGCISLQLLFSVKAA